MRCSDGHVRWGIYGVAGVVFVFRAAETRVMLQKRSAFAHEGGTWSCAVRRARSGRDAARGGPARSVRGGRRHPGRGVVVGGHQFVPASDWTYTTVVVEVDEKFGESINFETNAVGWFTFDEVDALPADAGFAAAWPHVRAIIAG